VRYLHYKISYFIVVKEPGSAARFYVWFEEIIGLQLLWEYLTTLLYYQPPVCAPRNSTTDSLTLPHLLAIL